MPALITLMRDVETFEPIGVNRLFLDASSAGRVTKIRGMMLGQAGAMMLSDWDELFYGREPDEGPVRLLVCEGLETGLAIKQGGPGRQVWALGSAGAIARLPVLFGVGHLVICADNDPPDPKTNLPPGLSSAIDCAKRWNASSHQKATIVLPEQEGWDFVEK